MPIWSENAPALENALHRGLHRNLFNKVNSRTTNLSPAWDLKLSARCELRACRTWFGSSRWLSTQTELRLCKLRRAFGGECLQALGGVGSLQAADVGFRVGAMGHFRLSSLVQMNQLLGCSQGFRRQLQQTLAELLTTCLQLTGRNQFIDQAPVQCLRRRDRITSQA